MAPLVVAPRGRAPGGIATLIDRAGRVTERYDLRAGTTYLLRPDQHVAARWRQLDGERLRIALARATGAARPARSTAHGPARSASVV